ncbi:hypothetical protein EHQ12_09940 [Leptospira gomenensis]|uniref:Uncharacterized protein n=1 Tax=Leptospira gomenensis TaxID=2484974 RepID=A0A5F1YB68_9LEPT|nr:hypothetical protein EHQ17_09595 [Leptospira gomenensis]TGK38540.1 hypothetical protein EHQ12_09940 [Leptospira gomenensis]TGK51050.1 hypothetical protein EHQ07_04120 [Leptospira gomenensis]TGK68309.1 hypothetical protein EHQ13_00775 [Leptospira gomenensis]
MLSGLSWFVFAPIETELFGTWTRSSSDSDSSQTQLWEFNVLRRWVRTVRSVYASGNLAGCTVTTQLSAHWALVGGRFHFVYESGRDLVEGCPHLLQEYFYTPDHLRVLTEGLEGIAPEGFLPRFSEDGRSSILTDSVYNPFVADIHRPGPLKPEIQVTGWSRAVYNVVNPGVPGVSSILLDVDAGTYVRDSFYTFSDPYPVVETTDPNTGITTTENLSGCRVRLVESGAWVKSVGSPFSNLILTPANYETFRTNCVDSSSDRHNNDPVTGVSHVFYYDLDERGFLYLSLFGAVFRPE